MQEFYSVSSVTLGSSPKIPGAELPKGASEVVQEENKVDQKDSRLQDEHDLCHGAVMALEQPQPAVALGPRRHIVGPQ